MYKHFCSAIYWKPSEHCINNCIKTVPASLERDISHKSIADSADSETSYVIVLSGF